MPNKEFLFNKNHIKYNEVKRQLKLKKYFNFQKYWDFFIEYQHLNLAAPFIISGCIR